MANSALREIALWPSLWSFILLIIFSLQLCTVRADSSVTISNTPTTTSSASSQTHTVKVGLADHKFEPDVVQAGIGDIIEFNFYPANHSVVRAEYDRPCVPYEMTGSNKSGFFSGFHSVEKVLDDPPSFAIRVNDTSPVFFYCSAPGSCINYGMVGAINPNTSTPISHQQQRARDSAYMLNPGESFPPEAPISSATSEPTSTAETSVAASKTSTGRNKHDLSAGVIAGIVVATVVVILFGILIFFRHNRTPKMDSQGDKVHVSPSISSWYPQQCQTFLSPVSPAAPPYPTELPVGKM